MFNIQLNDKVENVTKQIKAVAEATDKGFAEMKQARENYKNEMESRMKKLDDKCKASQAAAKGSRRAQPPSCGFQELV